MAVLHEIWNECKEKKQVVNKERRTCASGNRTGSSPTIRIRARELIDMRRIAQRDDGVGKRSAEECGCSRDLRGIGTVRTNSGLACVEIRRDSENLPRGKCKIKDSRHNLV